MQMSGGMKMWCRSLRVLPGLLLAWLASCGGGTQQIEPFQAQRVIFIGDETVGLRLDGRRYGINLLNTDGNFDCAQLPIWTQQLATNFGFTTDRCGGGAFGVTRAQAHAKAADIEGQISDQFATPGGVTPKDLFVVMVGMNDIIELYETFTGPKDCTNNNRVDTPLEEELARRGIQVAAQINRIIDANGRLIVSTVHDIGLTPYARVRGQTDLLTCMTAVFNARVRVEPIQDGRFWGLVLADDDTLAIVRSPSSIGVTNTTDAACTSEEPPDCTTATLVNPLAATYLWATDRHFGPLMHNQLASEAITRARNNPF